MTEDRKTIFQENSLMISQKIDEISNEIQEIKSVIQQVVMQVKVQNNQISWVHDKALLLDDQVMEITGFKGINSNTNSQFNASNQPN